MIGCYLLTREQIATVIRYSPVTNDGFFFCRHFPKLNSLVSPSKQKETGYSFDRSYFKDKFCFSNAEIEIYLEKGKSFFNIGNMVRKDDFLKNVVGDLISYSLNDKIKNKEYTLNELIDTTLFYYNVKYSF